MKIAQIRKMDISNGNGIGISIFTQGCPFHCRNCHNPETWNFDNGKLYSQEMKDKIIKLLEPEYITRFSILGGEPLVPQNIKELDDLIDAARAAKPQLEIWLWTGATFKDLFNLSTNSKDLVKDKVLLSLGWSDDDLVHLQNILKKIDYLIDGRFIEEQKDLSLAFRGSANQEIIPMQQSQDWLNTLFV